MLKNLITNQINNAIIVFKNTNGVEKNIDNFVSRIKTPERKINVSFNYNNKIYEGFRIQYNSLLGPYKGGIRIDNMVNEEECIALSFWMTIKTALFDLPYGGGKGGITANIRDLSKINQEGICRSYIKALYKNIGPYVDIPAPDLGSTSEMMDWMNDEYKILTGETSDATFTGKTLGKGGSLARTEATGYGVSFVTSHYVNKYMKSNGTYILQGFGNVGSHTCLYMKQFLPDYKLIAVGDHTGYYMYENGFDIDKLIEYNKINKSLQGLNAVSISKQDFFKTKCNIVIPAALEMEVDKEIALNLNCNLVVEGANGPLTMEADNVLKEKNIALIPDILANAGGVIVSYYEWEQNTKNIKYTFKEVIEKLELRLQDKMNDIYNNDGYIDYRVKCYVNSLTNLYKKFN